MCPLLRILHQASQITREPSQLLFLRMFCSIACFPKRQSSPTKHHHQKRDPTISKGHYRSPIRLLLRILHRTQQPTSRQYRLLILRTSGSTPSSHPHRCSPTKNHH